MRPDSRPRGLDSPSLPTVFKYAGRAHVWVYRRTGGRIGGRWRIGAGFRRPVPTLLLHHRGRRTGRSLVTPVLYLEHGPDLVVVASQGGRAEHPQWFHNLMAGPDVSVQVGRRVCDVRARLADPGEREALWPLLVRLYADFATYQAWTDREIPVVVLSPR